MIRLRISLAGMMGLFLALGLGLYTLCFPSEGAAAAVLLVIQAILAFAVLAVIYRTRARRAFWLGFALFGWGYMALTAESWWGHGADRPETLTSVILNQLEYYVRRTPGRQTFFWPFARPVSRGFQSPFVRDKLEEVVSMSFANETPLEDVLKYIKAATTGPNDVGIQIYVDPVALADAGKTMTSTVTLDVEGIPLKTTLRLLLKQLGLDYTVQDGVLKIGKPSTVSSAAPFRRLGHCYWALLAAFCGGYAGRILHNTNRAAPEA
jgi:hypothetical protein